MPYASDAQRRFMHAKHPKIAKKWDEEIRTKAHLSHHSPTKDTPMKAHEPKAQKNDPGHGMKKQKGEDTRSRAEEKIGSGPKGGKLITQPRQGSDENALSKRGMSSEEGAKHWKESGFKVPTDVHGHHHPGK